MEALRAAAAKPLPIRGQNLVPAIRIPAGPVRDSALSQVETDRAGYHAQQIRNIPASAGRLVKDAVVGGAEFADMLLRRDAPAFGNMLMALPAGIKQMVQDRYGSKEATATTFRDDPVGVASDLAGLVSGLSAARSAAMKVAPLQRAATATVRATVRPSAQLRREVFEGKPLGGEGVARAIIDQGVTTSERAATRLDAVEAQLDAVLKDARMSRGDIAKRLDNGTAADVRAQLERRQTLGESTGGANLWDERALHVLQQLENKFGQGTPVFSVSQPLDDIGALLFRRELIAQAEQLAKATPGLSPEDAIRAVAGGILPEASTRMATVIPLDTVNRLKREAQAIAYDKTRTGAESEIIQRGMAQALRQAVEDLAPDARPLNRQSQQLLFAKQALAAAEDRDPALTGILRGLLARGAARSGTRAGIGLARAGQMAEWFTKPLGDVPGTLRATLAAPFIARIAEQTGLSPELVEAALNNPEE
jgi:hypothetical protein